MINITFPDGNAREYEAGVDGFAIALSISKSLSKKAVALKVDGALCDLSKQLDEDAAIEIVLRDDAQALDLIRHDTAHIMAEAVQELWPGTQVTIGPSIEYGFYYDFDPKEPFSTEDFPKIEKKMREIVQRNDKFVREVWEREEAIQYFKEQGEDYKAELIRDLPGDDEISIYRQGEWLDLCLGPHLPSTGKIGTAFKLTKLAGAYWRGDHNNPMLQRIYGVAFANEKQLKAHLRMLEEAEKRDHRRIGREMDLFHFQEEAPGSVFWHAKGWSLFLQLISYMRRRQIDAGYVEVNSPDMMEKSLWETSGHWEKFGDHMFTTQTPDDKIFCCKPMNCPGHVQLFKHGLKSYRDLPLKIAEFGKVHRYEPSGALHGLMRVRSFTQDDAHVFCTPEQITEECIKINDLMMSIYKEFGFDKVKIKFSDRPEKRVGSDEIWDKSEEALKAVLEAAGVEWELNSGEGAFYGPKLEYVLRDAIGRDWQCGTTQLDFNLPGRLGAFYIGPDGEKHEPVMVHRAMFGSLERFTGILIEQHAGRFPLWLAPTQLVVTTITSSADGYAEKVQEKCRAAGLRSEIDLRNEKINYKVREHSVAKVPVMFVVGQREEEEGTVSVRRLGEKHSKVMPLEEAMEKLLADCAAPDMA
ncbi:MAG: threonine--tRNA ligase [Hyphomicrobiaceae bacterium]|nr:threonine--tRNA ligase [Hyphomicrobiaceae bacterium]